MFGDRIRSMTGRALTAAALVLGLAAAPAVAQPSLDVSIARALGSLNQVEESASRQTTAATVDAEHNLANERLRLFYSLDTGSYDTPGDWTYYLHTAGTTWRSTKGDSPRPTVFAGGTFSWRANGTSWSAADYRAVGLFTNVSWRPRPAATVRAGYRLDVRRFPDAAELDQEEHGFFGSLLLNLPSRTTIIGEARVGAKSYASLPDGTHAPAVPDAAGEAAWTTASMGGRGRGQGIGSQFSWPGTQGGWAERWAGGSTASLVSVMGRVAQSLADRTGVSLQYTRRLSFGGLPTAIVTTPALFFEDGIYDDPFASDAHTLRAGLKQVLRGGSSIEATAMWLAKDFRGTLALGGDGLELPGAPLRNDDIWRTGASWSLPILQGRTGPFGLELGVDYWFTRHRSNDAFYNYSSHTLALGVSLSH